MSWRFAALVVAIANLPGLSLSAQSAPTLDQLLDRMDAYLLQYETQLSSVVSDERFEQRMNTRTFRADGRVGSAVVQKLLESEIAFIRLPGGAEWLSFRDVRKVDGGSLRTAGPNLTALLTSGVDGLVQAKALALAGAEHNLGLFRTVNLPTMPLEIVHPSHRPSFRHWADGRDVVRKMATTVVGFEETARPTIVRQPDGTNVVSRGKVWVETATGRIARVEWVYVASGRAADAALPPRLTVDFSWHEGLGMLVPTSMREVFAVPRDTGTGDAVYTNFRRFGTGARIVPRP